MIRLVLVDDEALVRDGLRAILENEPDIEVVAEASDGEQALAVLRDVAADVVLLDVRMPRMDGLEACRRIVGRPAAPRVVMLTTFDHDEYVDEALRAGASGFLLKDVRRAQLTAYVRAAAAGETLLAPAIVRRLVEQVRQRARVTTSPRLAELTDRERQVLELVAAGLSNSEIAARLYVSESTVKTHLMRTLTKLGLRDRVHAVIFAYENGLVGPAS